MSNCWALKQCVPSRPAPLFKDLSFLTKEEFMHILTIKRTSFNGIRKGGGEKKSETSISVVNLLEL